MWFTIALGGSNCASVLFSFSDGERKFTDATGVELTGIAAARVHAILEVRDMKGSLAERTIQDCSAWKMIVVDANGEAILEIGFDLSPRSVS